jgi:hypothetical protein
MTRSHKARAQTWCRSAFLGAVLLALAGCAALPVSRTYLGGTGHGVYAEAPTGWQVLSSEEMLGRDQGGPPFLQGFAAGPVADPSAPMDADSPGGVIVVSLHPSLPDASAAARNAFIVDLDAAVAAGSARVLDESEPVTAEGFEWRQWTLEVSTASGTVMQVIQRVASSVEPVAADASGKPLHANKTIVIGCRPDCFTTQRPVIDQVLASLEIR